MKFREDFKKQMVPEWSEAYVDYDGLKRILREILRYKLSKQPETPLRSLQKKLSLSRTLSGLHLHLHRGNVMNKGDVENQERDGKGSKKDDSGQFHKTEFLGIGEGGEIEVEFFRKLDEELNKVNMFYKEKVEAVMDESTLLNKQLDALIALRIKVKSSGGNGSSLREHPSADISNMMPFRETNQSAGMGFMDPRSVVEMSGRSPLEEYSNSQSGSENLDVILQGINQDEESTSVQEINPPKTIKQNNGCQEVGNSSASQQDPQDILERVKINNTLESPLSTIKGVFKDSKDDELSFEKDELRKVEERLRVVFIEFYQKLRLLKHYSFMNLSALSKILNSYEKITSRRAARSYMENVDNSYIGSCDEVNNLLEWVEATFIKHFSNSNVRKGMKSLRPKTKKEKHSITFWSGCFSGFSTALLIAVVLRIETRKLMDKEGLSYMVNVFPLYSFFAYIVLHMLTYAADIYFWRRYRINYPFIFGFKQGTELGHRDVFLLGTGLAVLSLTCFLANLHLDLDSKTRNYKTLTEVFPLGLVAIRFQKSFWSYCFVPWISYIVQVVSSLLNPYFAAFVHPSTRLHFRTCSWQIILPARFHIVFYVQAIRSLDLYICYYGLGEFSQRQSKCHGHGVYNALYLAVAVIPFWLRFLQCRRRLFEEKEALQGFSGIKYLLTIVAVIIRTACELKKGMTWTVLALVSSAVATIVNTYWDIVIDWGLLRSHSKNIYLRDKLLVPHKSVYFAAMGLNIVLRVAWMQMILAFNLHSLHKMAIKTVVSCLEIIRCGISNFFRLENEHLNNVNKFRAFKSVPFPFNYDDEDSNKDD